MYIRVVAAIIKKNDKILIARRKKGTHLEFKWEYPGGKVEENENEKDALKRELLEEFEISSEVNIPVIASGGVGNLDHLVDGIKLGNASAVLAASIFHYGKHSVKEAKEYLDSKGIPVRVWYA